MIGVPNFREKVEGAQGRMAVLLTPNLVLNKDEVYGIAYPGTIELGGSVTAGTHRAEASAEARYVVRTAKAKTPLGDFSLEVSPIGAIGRAGWASVSVGRSS